MSLTTLARLKYYQNILEMDLNVLENYIMLQDCNIQQNSRLIQEIEFN